MPFCPLYSCLPICLSIHTSYIYLYILLVCPFAFVYYLQVFDIRLTAQHALLCAIYQANEAVHSAMPATVDATSQSG